MSTPTTLQTLPIILTTRSPTYSIPTEKYLIPSSWKRFQLSQLINKVLALPSPVPFDFVVDGEILRSSLAEWVKERECKGESRGTEETLEIEYIESVLPPQHVSSFEHDDWVSSVSVGKPG
jgi:ribosome biogenesis protein YTM1